MKDTVAAELQLIEERCEQAAPVGATALELLQGVYRDPMVSLGVRMRAAALALPFEAPKLSAIAMSNMDPATFAAQLDRAIARSGMAPIMIEGRAEPEPSAEER
jgi:hypothetical protein